MAISRSDLSDIRVAMTREGVPIGYGVGGPSRLLRRAFAAVTPLCTLCTLGASGGFIGPIGGEKFN